MACVSRNGHGRNRGRGRAWEAVQEPECKALFGKGDLVSSSTASTEASLSENSSQGGQTPPKGRGALRELDATPQALEQNFSSHPCTQQIAKYEQSTHKRTRRSNRRRSGGHVEGSAKVADAESQEYVVVEDRSAAPREVVTVSDLCFDFGPASRLGSVGSLSKVATVPDTIMEECLSAPVSPCRTRSGPSGIVSTKSLH